MDISDWVEDVHIKIDVLDDLLSGRADLDFSPGSLIALEAELLDRIEDTEELTDPDQLPFLECVVAYLGEMLLRVAGGRWAAPSSGLPVLRPAAELGLEDTAPLDLVAAAIQRRDGTEFRRTHRAWQEAVREYRQTHPGWAPEKDYTPGLDVPRPEPSAELDAWLARREQEFPAWRARYGAGEDWDFTADSLDALTEAVFRETPTTAKFQEHNDFVEGASWYWGEVLRRSAPAEWQHTPGERTNRSTTIGYFWVRRPDADRSYTPELNLAHMVELGDHKRLHTVLARWSG